MHSDKNMKGHSRRNSLGDPRNMHTYEPFPEEQRYATHKAYSPADSHHTYNSQPGVDAQLLKRLIDNTTGVKPEAIKAELTMENCNVYDDQKRKWTAYDSQRGGPLRDMLFHAPFPKARLQEATKSEPFPSQHSTGAVPLWVVCKPQIHLDHPT